MRTEVAILHDAGENVCGEYGEINLSLQVCVNLRHKLDEGDAKAAFLHSQDSETGILVESPELRQALSLRSNEIVQLRRKPHGLCDAPKEWLDGVTSQLTNAGWIAMTLEPRLCMLCEKGTSVCVALAHVGDMVVGLHSLCPLAQRKFEELQAAWKWRSWEVNEFIQTVILITQPADGRTAFTNLTDSGGLEEMSSVHPVELGLRGAERKHG